jgi:hypothetical protein
LKTPSVFGKLFLTKTANQKPEGSKKMIRYASLFSQVLGLFNRSVFQTLANKHEMDFASKGFSAWEQFAAMLFCHLAQAKSLREICGGLACACGKLRHLGIKEAPRKSTLSYANANRSWFFYQTLFQDTLGRLRFNRPGHRFRFKNKLLSLDATVIDLCLSLFPWAKYVQTKGAVKVHLLLDHDGYLPAFARITDGLTHEVRIARSLRLGAGSIIVIDRGFTDYSLFGKWCEQGVYFVCPVKSGAQFEIVDHHEPPKTGNVLMDNLIRLSSAHGQQSCPYLLRHVVVYDQKKDEEIVLLTNHLGLGATTISKIYKDRWQIEVFFKELKQHLRVKTFVGTTPNALKVQIWTALIAVLVLKYLQMASRFGWSLSQLVALLRMNLLVYRDLWEWANDPYQTPPPDPVPEQLCLEGI